jgi:hypothetical protein
VSEVRRPELSELVARLSDSAPTVDAAEGRAAIGRVVARLAALVALVPAIDLARFGDAVSRLVGRVRPAPKPTLRDRLGVKWGRPRLRVVIAALIVAGLAIVATRVARTVRHRAMTRLQTDADVLDIEPDTASSGDAATDGPRIEGIAIVEVVETDAIAEATRITNRTELQGVRAETTPWEEDGGSNPGSGDGMPVFDETQTAG